MTGKSDAEKLMGELFRFANKMLEEYGEFHPFGGYLRDSGEIVQVGAEGGDGIEKVARIEASFRELAVSDKVRVFGVVSNVSLVVQEVQGDAIQIFLEHRDGYCADVFFRYELSNAVKIVETTAQQGDGRLFRRSQ